MEVEPIAVTSRHLNTLDNRLTFVKSSAGLDTGISSAVIVAPPIPLRSETNNKTTRQTDERLRPVNFRPGEAPEHHSELNGILLCPPLPPRQPLRRSVSLTHRPPPPPARFLVQDNSIDALEPSSNHQLVHVPTDLPRSVNRTLARSDPLLDQVIPVSRWPLRDRPTHHHAAPNQPVQVIPLTRWPLPENAGHLAMDCITTKAHGGNEYVDSPTMARDRARPTCAKSADRSPHPMVHLIRPANDTAETASPNVVIAAGHSDGTVDADPLETPTAEKPGLVPRLRRFVRRARRSGAAAEDEPGDCKGRAVCRRCGQCCCPECSRSSVAFRCCGGKRDCSAESAIDVCSCMCCVRTIFYHCLKDENGEEDCSEEPCSCCSWPHCALRWTIMALLTPCLPCLCCYLPLRCLLRSCRACFGGPGCRCPRNLPPGIKGLLESESSSA